MPYQTVFVEFYEHVKLSINQGTFAKLTLAKTIGDTDLKNIYVRLHILETGGYKLALTLRYKTEEIESFHTLDEALTILSSYLKNPFITALLFTTEMDLTFKINKKNAGSLTEQPPTFKNASPVMLEMIEKGIVKL
ncbi:MULTISPECIES: hypothetical protein [Sphingobacterium]|jgi:hypothetical protein|uniref:hypothetical protein n=1 Tax=Sphingobacterium TaxID=28453 RepID=UPI00038A09DC|nr:MULTISPECIES: hypothetical protein [unclassified Sphingobacterium]KKX50254.1 hypothetical protein L950_0211570 [Sphingobacterium sp. IITKGP-BTPF85]MCS3554551.1 hypothetical protein [Sphingobacterium sp. JUb21]NJI73452.1 hypothetical protein [Sphingobacterium sp. B16(2022)]TCR07541.1 hypothetical protein EDF66_105173 [Sphingobacterium sp. JUb20]